jgi:threonine dehydrogenase-like Zn-dependent dehydrogenase
VMAPRTMRSAVLVAPRRFEVREVPVPQPLPNQVRVRIEGCGVCGANLSPWQGRPWFLYPLPAGAPGHEAWGRVDEVGSDVRGVQVGDRVAGVSQCGFAEYDLFEQHSLVVLPRELEGEAVPAEPLGCAMNAFRRSRIRAGHTVAVVGIGFFGALLVSLAAAAGARVIAVSRRPFSRDLAREMGADQALPFDALDLPERIFELTGARGCDRVIEAIGNQDALDLASQLTCLHGRLIIAGFHQDGARQVDMLLWNWRGLDVVNAHEREPAAQVDGMRSALLAMARGDLDPDPLYTHRVPLERIGDAFSAMESRDDGFVKGLVLAA